MTLCLMDLLPVDDLIGPIYSASLRPHRLLGRFRPTQPRVDVLALRHCATAVSIQVDMTLFVNRYDLPKVGVLPQPYRGLGHAIAAPAPNYSNRRTSVSIQHMCIKASKATKDLGPRPNYKIQRY
jgi:hypothetical protein